MKQHQEESTKSSAASESRGESEEFVRRRDYLMTKLLQSRNLPGETTTTTPPPPPPLMTLAPTTSRPSAPIFRDEFIPIRFNPPLRIEDTYEDVNGTRLAPYPSDCIKRAAEHLKFLFSDLSPFVLHESNQAQRTFEIIKLKVGLKSKFDNDAALLRRIERNDYAAIKSIHDRRKEIDMRVARQQPSKSTVIDLTSDEELEAETGGQDEHSEDTEDEKELIKLIAREDRVNLDNEDEDSDVSSKVT